MSKKRSLLMPLQELKDRGTLPGDPRGSVIAGCPGHPRMSPCARPCSGKEREAEREDSPLSLVRLCLPRAGGAAALLPRPLGCAGEDNAAAERDGAHPARLGPAAPLTPSASPVCSASPQRETARAVHLPQQLTNIAFTIIIAITVI